MGGVSKRAHYYNIQQYTKSYIVITNIALHSVTLPQDAFGVELCESSGEFMSDHKELPDLDCSNKPRLKKIKYLISIVRVAFLYAYR